MAPDNVARDVERNLDRATGVVRDVVLIMFEQSASLAERRSVIASTRGRVIGGVWHETDVEGFYVVRIPDTGDPRAVFTVIDDVSKCPCVDFATAWKRLSPAWLGYTSLLRRLHPSNLSANEEDSIPARACTNGGVVTQQVLRPCAPDHPLCARTDTVVPASNHHAERTSIIRRPADAHRSTRREHSGVR